MSHMFMACSSSLAEGIVKIRVVLNWSLLEFVMLVGREDFVFLTFLVLSSDQL